VGARLKGRDRNLRRGNGDVGSLLEIMVWDSKSDGTFGQA